MRLDVYMLVSWVCVIASAPEEPYGCLLRLNEVHEACSTLLFYDSGAAGTKTNKIHHHQ